MNDLDLALFRWVNQGPESLRGFLGFFSEATNLLWVKIVLGLLVFGMLCRPGAPRKAALAAVLSVGLANGSTDILKHWIPQNRPFQDHADVILRAGWSASHGTASAHSANMAAVALVFVMCVRGWGIPWVFVAILTGISRVYVGVHYPHQVLLGWVCGLLAASVVLLTWDRIQRRSTRVSKPDLEAITP